MIDGCEVYPVPPELIRILDTTPFVIIAVAAAPEPPPPTIDTRGDAIKPEPPLPGHDPNKCKIAQAMFDNHTRQQTKNIKLEDVKK